MEQGPLAITVFKILMGGNQTHLDDIAIDILFKTRFAIKRQTRCDIIGIAGDETGIGLVDEYHCVGGDMLHDIANLLRSQSITSGVVWTTYPDNLCIIIACGQQLFCCYLIIFV